MTRLARNLAAVVGAATLLAGVGGMAWLALEHNRAMPAQRLTAVAANRAFNVRPAPAAQPASSHAHRVPGPAPISPVTAPKSLKPDEIEICGYGVAKADSPAADEMERAANADTDGPLSRHLGLMTESGDPPTRAAGLMALHDFAPLVDMALHTSDPTVYALALGACFSGGPTTGPNQPCQMLSADRAAQLDPDNAAVWVDVATVAQQRRDSDTVAAALYRASIATRVQSRSQAFAALALAALPAQLPAAERTSVVVRLIGIQAGLLGADYRSAVAYCSAAGMADSNRRQICEALAELLVAQGTSVIDLAIGRSIGARTGWPAERVELLSARVEAYMRAPVDELFAAPGGPVSCANMQRAERFWSAADGKGQRAYAEVAVARAGLSDADLVARYREHLRQRTQAAAASAAAAPQQ